MDSSFRNSDMGVKNGNIQQSHVRIYVCKHTSFLGKKHF